MINKLAAIMIVILVVFISVSCAQTTKNSPIFITGIEKTDFLGKEFIFLVNNTTYSNEALLLGYVENTPFADLARQRIAEVEEKYNIDFTVISDSKGTVTRIQNESGAGIVSIAAAQDSSTNMAPGARAGLFADLAKLTDYLDFRDSDKWGTKEQIKPMFWDGGIYGVVPSAIPLLKYGSTESLVVVNEAMIKRMGETDPREFVENGTWTWDTFEEKLPIYAHTDDSGKYIYAIDATVHWFFRAAQISNGVPPVYKDEEGIWQLGVNSQESRDGISRAYNWAYGEFAGYVNIDQSNAWEGLLKRFTDGGSVLSILNATHIYGTSDSVAYVMDDFGLVHYPLGPNGSYEKCATSFNQISFITSIPELYGEPEFSAFILDKIYEPFPGYEDEQSVIDYMNQYYFFDERDTKVFINGFKNAYYEYRNENLTDMLIDISGSKTVSEWYSSFEKANEQNRVEYAVNIESSADELYGG